jgi:hypothetical protein
MALFPLISTSRNGGYRKGLEKLIMRNFGLLNEPPQDGKNTSLFKNENNYKKE